MRRAFALLAMVAFCLPCHAQVTARQGAADSAPNREFTSPMVLEVPFVPETWEKERLNSTNSVRRSISQGRRLDLSGYECDKVVVNSVIFVRSKPRNGVVRYWVEAETYTRPGIDKLVTVTFEILQDPAGQPEAAATVRDIDAEEKKLRAGVAELLVPETVLATSPPPTLRITVSVRDNG